MQIQIRDRFRRSQQHSQLQLCVPLVAANNASYLVQLAQIVCDMKNAGYQDSDIGGYLARRENLPYAGAIGTPNGYALFLDADIYYCTREHPRITP